MIVEIIKDIKEYINLLNSANLKTNLVSRNINFILNDNFFIDLNNFLKLQFQYLIYNNYFNINNNNLNYLDKDINDNTNLKYKNTNININTNTNTNTNTNIEYQSSLNILENKYQSNTICYHILNSAQLYIVSLFKVAIQNKNTFEILDVGSGNGFPGIIIAILYKYQYLYDYFNNTTINQSKIKLYLCDCSTKKIDFLLNIKKQLNLDIEIINTQIQESKIQKFDLLLSRAFSSKISLFKAIEKISYLYLIILKSKDYDANLIYRETNKIKQVISINGFASNIILANTKIIKNNI
ncbi:MAG: RsmG family class I SAM-dependent methyltransferase [Rickettsiales bacterium]